MILSKPRMRRGNRGCALRTLLVLSLCSSWAIAGGLAREAILIDHPAAAGSAEASLAVFDGKLYMTWFEAESKRSGTLKLAAYDGKDWTAPTTLLHGDNLFINWADFPQFAATQGLMAITWLEMIGADTYAYGIRYRTSADGGRNWTAPAWLHEDLSPSEHGFVSLAPAPSGGIAAVWLDGRAMPAGGAMQLRFRILTAAGPSDERAIDQSTCECCNTDLVVAGDRLLTAYRDKTQGHIRDIYSARFQGGDWEDGTPVHGDGWEIHGCPVNGPAMDAAGTGVVMAWFTAAEARPRVMVAFSGNQGRDYATPLALGNDPVGRVDCRLLADGTAAVSWVDGGEAGSQVSLAICRPGSPPSLVGEVIKVDRTPEGRVSGFPRLAQFGDRLILAYQSPQEAGIRLKSISLAPR